MPKVNVEQHGTQFDTRERMSKNSLKDLKNVDMYHVNVTDKMEDQKVPSEMCVDLF